MQKKQAPEKILVIKLSALGDFIQALGPMAAIRKHHPDAHITLLTTKMLASFGEKSGYFDEVMIDGRPKFFDLPGWINLRNNLVRKGFSRVYDLQNNDRTCFYFKLFPSNNKPEWVGIAKGASHQNTSEQRTAGHAFEGHVDTLKKAGIQSIEIDDMKWIQEDVSGFSLKSPYILFVPGSAPQHPQKRWSAESYGTLANALNDEGYQVVLLGTAAEKDVTDEIEKTCPRVLNLSEQTSLFQIVSLAHNAKAAIGNDTGPMHMIGPTGCPTLVLFSKHSNPERHAPKGKHIKTLQKDSLSELETDHVFETFKNHIASL